MKKLFTLLVIFTFFVSALSVAQIQKKGDEKKIDLKKKEVVQDNTKVPLNQNTLNNSIFPILPMSPDAVSGYTFTSSSGTYTAITGGTLIRAGTSTMDSYVSGAITIPSFTFNGVAYTTAYVTSNGLLTLGGSAPSSTSYTGISVGSGSGICICPMNADLNRVSAAATSEMRWQTIGSEVIFQWQAICRYAVTESFDFQIRLNTSTGNVVFVYKLNSGPGASTSYQPEVGIRTSATDYKNVLVASGTETWAAPLAGASNTSTCRFTSTAPAKNFTTGLTYTFAVPIVPTLLVSPSTLSFGYTASGNTSSNMTYSLSGTYLTGFPGNIVVTAPSTIFEVSLDGTNFYPSVNVAYSSATLSATTIYARFKPTSANTDYTGNITNVGGGTASPPNVVVSGTSYPYCTPTNTPNSSYYINNFSTTGGTTNITNNSSGYNGGYVRNLGMNVTQAQNGTVNFSVTGDAGGSNTYGFAIWVDWNHSNTFDAGERMYVTSGYVTSASGSFTVPGTATLGNTGMRVIGDYNNSAPSTPCAMTNGEAEDYIFNVTAATSPILNVTPTSIAFGYTAYPGTSSTQTYVLSGTNLGAGPIVVTPPSGFEVSLDGSTWYSTTLNVTYTPPTLANTTIYTHFKPLAANSNYSGNITNAGGSASTKNVAVTGTSLITYCTPTYANGGGTDFMTQVTLGTLSQATASNVSPYWLDYRLTQNAVPDLQQGSTNNLSLTFSSDGTQYNGVWIDFNKNGTFETSEFFTSNTNAGSNGTVNVVITVPGGATLGQTVMRIRGGDDTQPLNTQACGVSNSTYGQAQDYWVNITAGSSMTYTSSTTTQNTSSLAVGSTNQQIIGIEVVTTGGTNPLSITDFALNTIGTTEPANDIINAKIFYTGTSSTFSAIGQFGSTVANPDAPYNISGSQTLAQGTNYFWLTYDIPGGATGGHNVDAECTEITIVTAYTPTVTAPAGERQIVGPIPAGTYTVGLAAFNIATGRNIYEQIVTRSLINDDSKRISIINDTKNTTNKSDFKIDRKDGTERKIMTELTHSNSNENKIVEQKGNEETVKVLYENGKPYNGPLYFYKDKNKVVSEKGNNGLSKSNTKNSNEYQTDGPNAGVYATITAAITDLNTRGISGAVVFSLTDADYPTETLPLIINAVTGASATNTVTIKPASGVTTTITGSSSVSIFKLNGADYVTIDGSNNGSTSKNLTIENTNTSSFSSVIVLSNNGGSDGAKNNTIKNCNIKGPGGTNVTIGIFGQYTGGDYDNTTVSSNKIFNCYDGIFIAGSPGGIKSNDCQIIDNIIGDNTQPIGFMGIRIGYCDNMQILRNDIFGQSTGNTNYSHTGCVYAQGGIDIDTASTNTKIISNKIHDFYYSGTGGWGSQGIRIMNEDVTTTTQIINNVIYNIKADGDSGYLDSNPNGILIWNNAGNIQIYYNSIYLSGNVLGSTYNGYGSGVRIGSATLLDLKNNIVQNSMTGSGTNYTFGIWSNSANTAFTDINYNDYFVNGNNPNIGRYSTTNYSTLISWVGYTGKDANSVSGNPGFTSNTDLTPNTSDANSWVLSGNGIHLAGVTTDYAGVTRPADVTAGAPDIGAYEFTAGASVPNSFVITPISGSNDILVNGRKLINLYFSNLGGISSIDVKYYSGINPPGTSGFPVMNGYFVITPTGGSGFVYDITYFYSEPQRGGVVDETLIRLSKSDNGGTNWIAYTAPGTGQDQYILDYTTTNSIKVHQLSTFSTFTNGGGDAPLPVTLSSFSSSSNGRDVKLMWKTEKEINNSGFDVERKTDGSNLWSKVGYVKGSGSTNLPVNYTFEDKKLNSGKYNYRLKQIDYNGNFEYHNLTSGVDVALPTKFNLSQNYPNPFNPITKIDFDLPFDSKVNIVLYDMTGREVKTLVNESRTAGFHTVTFNASVLSSGTYFYRIITKSSAKDFVATKKMVLIK